MYVLEARRSIYYTFFFFFKYYYISPIERKKTLTSSFGHNFNVLRI